MQESLIGFQTGVFDSTKQVCHLYKESVSKSQDSIVETPPGFVMIENGCAENRATISKQRGREAEKMPLEVNMRPSLHGAIDKQWTNSICHHFMSLYFRKRRHRTGLIATSASTVEGCRYVLSSYKEKLGEFVGRTTAVTESNSPTFRTCTLHEA